MEVGYLNVQFAIEAVHITNFGLEINLKTAVPLTEISFFPNRAQPYTN